MRPTSRTYAEVAATRPAASKAAHLARSSHAGQNPRQRTRQAPPRHPQASCRIIARWNDPVPQTATSLNRFLDRLNNSLFPQNFRLDNTHPRKAIAANVTKAGSVVIHTAGPTVAAELLENPQWVHEAASSIPNFERPDNEPTLNLDVPWYGMVIHDIPAASLVDAFDTVTHGEGIWDRLEREAGVVLTEVKGNLKILCRQENIENQDRLSLLVRFENQHCCNCLLRNGGVSLLETWCRVSRYQPRVPLSRPTNDSPQPIICSGPEDLDDTTSENLPES